MNIDPTESFNPRIIRGTHIITEPLNVFKLLKRLELLPQDMIPKIIAPDGEEYCIKDVLFEDDNCVSLKLIPLQSGDQLEK